MIDLASRPKSTTKTTPNNKAIHSNPIQKIPKKPRKTKKIGHQKVEIFFKKKRYLEQACSPFLIIQKSSLLETPRTLVTLAAAAAALPDYYLYSQHHSAY
jgi:hypothetical protein